MQYEVERKQHAYTGRNTYPWQSMEVGDSFFVPISHLIGIGSLRSAAHKAGKRWNRKYKVKWVEDGENVGHRIWRTE